MKPWVNVVEASMLVGKSTRAIYRWIDGKRLTPKVGERGETLVRAEDVMRVESETKRGRPRITQ